MLSVVRTVVRGFGARRRPPPPGPCERPLPADERPSRRPPNRTRGAHTHTRWSTRGASRVGRRGPGLKQPTVAAACCGVAAAAAGAARGRAGDDDAAVSLSAHACLRVPCRRTVSPPRARPLPIMRPCYLPFPCAWQRRSRGIGHRGTGPTQQLGGTTRGSKTCKMHAPLPGAAALCAYLTPRSHSLPSTPAGACPQTVTGRRSCH